MANLTKVEMVVERVVIEGVTYERTDDSAKVGDIIRIGDEDVDFLTDGGYYEVVRVDSYGDPQIIDDDGDEHDTADLSDVYTVFRRVDGISKAAEPSHRLKVGDYAKVLRDIMEYSAGEIVEIIGDKTNSDAVAFDFKVKRLSDGTTNHYIDEKDLVRATYEEEVRQAKEAAKWAKIGRKVGEIQKGDIVRVTDNCGSPLENGSIHVADKPFPSGGAYIDGWAVDCELIAPVESRFDAAQ